MKNIQARIVRVFCCQEQPITQEPAWYSALNSIVNETLPMTHTSTALKRHLLAPAVLVLSMLLSGSVLAQEAPDNSTKDPVEMEVNLKDVVKFRTMTKRKVHNLRLAG